MSKNLYLDINVLQTVPSSNINRDDTGAPKTAFYGGVMRARVSSQSWKRATRKAFAEDGAEIGTRTLKVPQLLADKLMELDSTLSQEDADKMAADALGAAGIKVKKGNVTGALLMVSKGQIESLAKYVLAGEELDKKEAKKNLLEGNSLDLALFGRMVADNPELNVDASAQVAHAISTHEIIPEYDYFTALDDLQGKEQSGAALIQTTQYDSATLYRYANVNINELAHNLDGKDAVEGAVTFVKDFALSMPTGKQNSFANKTVPSYLMVTVRDDTPVNLVSAFEQPATARDGKGYLESSVNKLEAEFVDTQAFVDAPLATLVAGKFDTKIGEKEDNLNDLLDKLRDVLKKAVEDEDLNN